MGNPNFQHNADTIDNFINDDTPKRVESVKDSLTKFISMAAQDKNDFVNDADKTNMHLLHGLLTTLRT